MERGGAGEEKGGARRPYNIHVIVRMYLQLKEENSVSLILETEHYHRASSIVMYYAIIGTAL